MIPTPEQIAVALRYADTMAEVLPHTSLATLSSAYRDQQREIEEMRETIGMLETRHSAAMLCNQAQVDTLKSKPCDFCNESPQTENEKKYYEEFKNMMGELPMMGEWLARK